MVDGYTANKPAVILPCEDVGQRVFCSRDGSHYLQRTRRASPGGEEKDVDTPVVTCDVQQTVVVDLGFPGRIPQYFTALLFSVLSSVLALASEK